MPKILLDVKVIISDIVGNGGVSEIRSAKCAMKDL